MDKTRTRTNRNRIPKKNTKQPKRMIKMKEKIVIVKIRENTNNGQKLINIPRNAKWLNTGDYVTIKKVQQ